MERIDHRHPGRGGSVEARQQRCRLVEAHDPLDQPLRGKRCCHRISIRHAAPCAPRLPETGSSRRLPTASTEPPQPPDHQSRSDPTTLKIISLGIVHSATPRWTPRRGTSGGRTRSIRGPGRSGGAVGVDPAVPMLGPSPRADHRQVWQMHIKRRINAPGHWLRTPPRKVGHVVAELEAHTVAWRQPLRTYPSASARVSAGRACHQPVTRRGPRQRL